MLQYSRLSALRSRISLRIVIFVVLGFLAALFVLRPVSIPQSVGQRISAKLSGHQTTASRQDGHAEHSRVQSYLPLTKYTRPANVPIYGFVFAGRAVDLRILDCYLRRNLAVSGGWLDEVHFVQNTDDQESIDWLQQRVQEVPQYRLVGVYPTSNDYNTMWLENVQSGAIYVKLDDDLLFLSDKAIEEVVTTLVAHPEAYVVLGNLVNSANLGWVHHHNGAIHAYAPESAPPPKETSAAYGPTAWRPSELPTHPSSGGTINQIELFLSTKDVFQEGLHVGDLGAAPYKNHRWLPLRNGDAQFSSTPMWHSECRATGIDLTRWALGAQQHYSLFENLEAKNLDAYQMGNVTTGVWNLRQSHSNLNFIAIWADDILEHLHDIEANDETMITEVLPRRLKRQSLLQSRALAAHFSFYTQSQMNETDIRSRYRAYANEFVCHADNQVPIPTTLFSTKEGAIEEPKTEGVSQDLQRESAAAVAKPERKGTSHRVKKNKPHVAAAENPSHTD